MVTSNDKIFNDAQFKVPLNIGSKYRKAFFKIETSTDLFDVNASLNYDFLN